MSARHIHTYKRGLGVCVCAYVAPIHTPFIKIPKAPSSLNLYYRREIFLHLITHPRNLHSTSSGKYTHTTLSTKRTYNISNASRPAPRGTKSITWKLNNLFRPKAARRHCMLNLIWDSPTKTQGILWSSCDLDSGFFISKYIYISDFHKSTFELICCFLKILGFNSNF